MARRRGDEAGVALPSPVILLSALAVAVAVVAFFVTNGGDRDDESITPAADSSSPSSQAPSPSPSSSPSASASPSKSPTADKKKSATEPATKKPSVNRGRVYVEVYNNTNISGLASQVSGKASTLGWNVVGADNWLGTIPANTVYFPPQLEAAAKQLALDLGIKRTRAAEQGSMKPDRLTVILVAPLA